MSPGLTDFMALDLMPLLAAALAALSCGIIGNYLVLKRMAMMGDAISHSVLPGLIVAFLLLGEATTFPMLAGAAVAGVACALLVGAVRRLARLDEGSSMGVVFTIMFALGVVLVSINVRNSHVDADCVLYGAIEHLSLVWEPPATVGGLFSLESIGGLPRQVQSLALTLAIVLVFVGLFYKELRISSFDPEHSSAQGVHAGVMHVALLLVVALSVVASFEAVGVILVVAMLACPAAMARMMTDRLGVQIALSAALALVMSTGGYFLATRWPAVSPDPGAVELESSGMIATLGGVGVLVAVLLSPRYGLAASALRKLRYRVRVLSEDQLAMLYRVEESAPDGDATLERRHLTLGVGEGGTERLLARAALRSNVRGGRLERRGDQGFALTESGREHARSLVRVHRLWEAYLVRELGLRPDHVHGTAMDLEHVREHGLSSELERESGDPGIDPHGKTIPR